MNRLLLILLLLLAGCQPYSTGPAPAVVSRATTTTKTEGPGDWAQAYQKVQVRMTEDQVRQAIGAPGQVTKPQSGLTTWIYGQGQGTGPRDSGLVVTFAGGRVLRVVFQAPLDGNANLDKLARSIRSGMSESEVWAVAGIPTSAERVGAERDVTVLTYGDPAGSHLEVNLLDGKVADVRSRK